VKWRDDKTVETVGAILALHPAAPKVFGVKSGVLMRERVTLWVGRREITDGLASSF
jgi:hypothetical protein